MENTFSAEMQLRSSLASTRSEVLEIKSIDLLVACVGEADHKHVTANTSMSWTQRLLTHSFALGMWVPLAFLAPRGSPKTALRW